MSIADKIRQLKQDIDAVFAAGKQAEYGRYWDAFQENGQRTSYSGAFRGASWSDALFYPKYDIVAVGSASNMFHGWSTSSPEKKNFDLAARLEECGVVLDTSQVTDASNMFAYGTPFTRLPALDLSKTANSTNVFQACENAVTIDQVAVAETTTFTGWFTNDRKLANIIFAGVIANDLNLQWCPLSKASISNITGCLSNTATGKTLTLKKTAVQKAFETASGENDGDTSAEWLALAATRNNWTISLV